MPILIPQSACCYFPVNLKFVKKITGYGMFKQYVSEINSAAHLMPARDSMALVG